MDLTLAGNTWSDVVTVQGIILLVMMPMLDEVKMAWIYTAVPLYWIDRRWSLLSLGLVLSLAYVPRMLMAACVRRFGDWLLVPAYVLAATASVPVLIYPTNMTALVVGLYGCSLTVNTQAFRSLVYVLYGHEGPLQQKAMRMFTLSDVLGYSVGPAIGGILYDNAGYTGCVLFQVSVLSSQSLLCVFMPAVWASATCFRQRNSPRSSGSSEQSSPATDGSSSAITKHGSTASAHMGAPPDTAATEAAMWLPVFWIQSAYFTNLFVYVVEWNLYALYFRQVHGWSGTWMGVAQMSGDLFAGIILVLLTTEACKATASAWAKRYAHMSNMCGPPYCVAVILLVHGALLVLLAQPDFTLSLCGQVGMGTTYILTEQVLQEMLVQYSASSHTVYRRRIFVQYIIFCCCFLFAGFLSAPSYQHFGSTVPFYSCALLACLTAVAFGGFFMHRLASTQSGLLGGLVAAEKELLARRKQSELPSANVASTATDAARGECVGEVH